MRDRLEKLSEEALALIGEVADILGLVELESRYLGRSGALTSILKGLGRLEPSERPSMGQLANKVKESLEEALKSRRLFLDEEKLRLDIASSGIDVTLPGPSLDLGSEHPVLKISRELEDVFESMGYVVWDGPEVEYESNNFDALNIPKDHPARESHDTVFMHDDGSSSRLCMRTHTSPVQIRALRELGAPLRVIAPGRVFRKEAQDATHEHTFHQMEGLVVDEGIGVPHMLHAMNTMLESVFGHQVETRLRPGFFPFVEPGFELDARCPFCDNGCKVCKGSRWIELMPGGLVHPNVLKSADLDPDKYSGFAFGLGLSRMAMLRYNIHDIRYMFSGDIRFLHQF